MTPDQIELARHALGLPHATKTSWRNHFVTGSDSPDYEPWMQMVEAGLAKRRNPSPLTGGDYCFLLTRQGAETALEQHERLGERHFPSTPDHQSQIIGG